MKKDKITAVIVFLTVIFIVFVFGLYIGKKFSSKSPKEGIIKESALKKGSGSFFQGTGKTQNGGTAPGTAGKIKFAPISKLSALKKGKKLKKPAEKITPEKPAPVKPVVKTKIVYVKKPIYVYKYKYVKTPPSNPFNSKVYYTIQVAALSKYSQAKAMADKLNSMGFFAYIVPISVSGKSGKAVYQQVRVGKFATEQGANSVEGVIAKKFKVKPYVIKVD
ncbi:MAG: SPOR domain-containing protein [Candidatus Acidulodesulfobacterium sp.]